MISIAGLMNLVAQEGPAGAAPAPDLSEIIQHHLTDSHEIDLPFFLGTWHLPTGWIVNLGPLGPVDFSPTKHVVLMLAAAILTLLIFIPLGAAAKRAEHGKSPRGFANGMEAMILYFRDEIVRKNIGHGSDAYAPYIL